MADAKSITEEFISSSAVNSSALSNAKKISKSGGFKKLCKSADETLIFGDCYGSGSKPYNASVDLSVFLSGLSFPSTTSPLPIADFYSFFAKRFAFAGRF